MPYDHSFYFLFGLCHRRTQENWGDWNWMKHIRFHSVLMMLIGTRVTCHSSVHTPVVLVTCKEPGLEVNDKKMLLFHYMVSIATAWPVIYCEFSVQLYCIIITVSFMIWHHLSWGKISLDISAHRWEAEVKSEGDVNSLWGRVSVPPWCVLLNWDFALWNWAVFTVFCSCKESCKVQGPV
jgi:hypothetical protein